MNEADIERLLSKFDNSGLQELKINGNGVDVYFSKLEEKQPTTVTQSNKKSTTSNEGQPSIKTGNYKLKAPMVGLIYFAPSPDKPAYKEVGSHVKKGEVICAVEAMKLINEVKSPVSGTIKKRLVDDGDMIEYNQPLFEIKED